MTKATTERLYSFEEYLAYEDGTDNRALTSSKDLLFASASYVSFSSSGVLIAENLP